MEELLYKYTLQNALKYQGKANIGSIIGKVLSEQPTLKKDMPLLNKVLSSVISKVNAMSAVQQLQELTKIAPELLEEKKIVEERRLTPLPGETSNVLLRIAPYPSGPLHLGNAKTIILNDEYVKIYKGKLLLILDDTIGSEEKNIEPDAYELIPQGLAWLGVNFESKLIYKSDRLDIYYKYAELLIKKGVAYTCTCVAELLREQRAKGLDCACRGKSLNLVLEDWVKMLSGGFNEGEIVLRLKTDMRHPNPAFRDRVLFRVCTRNHPRVGNRYKVWPLLEFSWAIDDYLLHITHVIRGKELRIESDMELFIWNIFEWKGPELLHTGLLTIEGVKLSKSKSKQEVKSGAYFGWDDPRTWSLQSLKRRGFKPEAIRIFCLSFGVHENEAVVSVDKIYSENRKLIEKDANRYFLVEEPVLIQIEGAPSKEVHLRLHPDFPERGERKFLTTSEFYISQNDYIRLEEGKVNRLMDCLNFLKKGDSLLFHSLEYEHYRDSKQKGIIMHYVPKDHCVPIQVLMDDARLVRGFGEGTLVTLKPGEVIQAERRFFCKFDALEEGVYHFWFTHK